MTNIILVSNQNDILKISKKAAYLSDYFFKYIINYIENNNLFKHELILPFCNTKILRLIVMFCEYYCNNPFEQIVQPITTLNILQIIKDPFYSYFLNFFKNNKTSISINELYNIASKLGIMSLMELCIIDNILFIKSNREPQCKAYYTLIKNNIEEYNINYIFS